jgi:hypothetical protein
MSINKKSFRNIHPLVFRKRATASKAAKISFFIAGKYITKVRVVNQTKINTNNYITTYG